MAKKAAAAAATPPAFKSVVIPVKLGWLATDTNGDVYWYNRKPSHDGSQWKVSSHGDSCKFITFGPIISERESAASLVEIKKASKLELRLVTE